MGSFMMPLGAKDWVASRAIQDTTDRDSPIVANTPIGADLFAPESGTVTQLSGTGDPLIHIQLKSDTADRTWDFSGCESEVAQGAKVLIGMKIGHVAFSPMKWRLTEAGHAQDPVQRLLDSKAPFVGGVGEFADELNIEVVSPAPRVDLGLRPERRKGDMSPGQVALIAGGAAVGMGLLIWIISSATR